MKKGHIFFISGVAGAGKGTVIRALLKDETFNLNLALSCKTREPRIGEKPGIDYIKLTLEEFKKSIENNEFLEYNFIHNQAYYGTRIKDVLDDGINLGRYILKEMDILILPKVLEENKISREHFTYIFLDIPLEEIKNRMASRGDDVTGNDYVNRINSAKKEKELIYLADHIIDASLSPEETLLELKKIINNKINQN
ncbi:MAG: guanylate kinase [Candidatus Gracilibacteria bacterium]|nr:guanylate kinase [Candidatus Gracilibacteria bacterium]